MSTEEQKQSFQTLIEQNKGILFKVASMYCQDETDRQDLIQEIMIQIWRSFTKYNNQFKISTWVYRISLNVAISFYRKNENRKRNNISLNEDISQIPEDNKSEEEVQLNLLLHFISELKEIDKALIILYLEDKSYPEIADILGISVSNVGTKIGRIKKSLKQRFLQINI